ncbi:MAG: hypothetical protein GEU26_15810 [Nitrososphaeraceae archaeon]|nr:hypothetical protein [Nitrososphaeraceae archaeon]
MSGNNHKLIMAHYQNFRNKKMHLFSKVDGDLILDILKFQNEQEKWPGSVTLKIKYQAETVLNFIKDSI